MWILARDATQESSTTQKHCHSERHYREESAVGGAQKRNDIAFRSGFAKTPISRRTPKRKTEN
jgi:hypothetical protein